jgi:hypothetical protein
LPRSNDQKYHFTDLPFKTHFPPNFGAAEIS